VQKPLYKASPRLQKLLIRLQKYHVKSINYIPGKYLYLADTLSRAYIQPTTVTDTLEEDVVMVHSLMLDSSAKQQLQQAYEEDPTLAQLKTATMDGWAKWRTKKAAPAELQPFWTVRDELYVRDGLLFKGEQLVIPNTQRKSYLRRIHSGHLGMEKSIERAKQSVYWPGMVQQIKDLIATCASCLRFANNQQRMPLLPHAVPELPWNKLAMDILEFKGRSYLVVVDFYSHYPELRLLAGKTAKDVIMALKSVFAVHGVPVEVIADNMPFNSALLKQFAAEWSFTITTASPHFPSSNGMAERYVQTVKQFLKKAEDNATDVYQSLLAYRQTPIAGLPFSPAEMLFSRCIRGPLPYTDTILSPMVVPAKQLLEQRQRDQKQRYDRGARNMEPLEDGASVMIRTPADQEWTRGTVVTRAPQPRSYIVETDKGQLRRTRAHLKPITTTTGSDSTEPNVPPGNNLPDTTTSPTIDPREQPPFSRRSARTNKGVPPAKYKDYNMN
jgi:hypothetical protein